MKNIIDSADRLVVGLQQVLIHLDEVYERWSTLPYEERGRYHGDVEQAREAISQWDKASQTYREEHTEPT